MVDDPVVFYFCASTGTRRDVELFIPVFEIFRESKWTRAGCFQLCKLFWEKAAGFLISFFCIVPGQKSCAGTVFNGLGVKVYNRSMAAP